jgi:hypothetical protein
MTWRDGLRAVPISDEVESIMHEARREMLNPRQRAAAGDDPESQLHSKINSGPDTWDFFNLE